MRLLAAKPLAVASLAVSAVTLSAAGGFLQSPSEASPPKTVIKVVPSPGSTTIIIQRTQPVSPGPTASSTATVVTPSGAPSAGRTGGVPVPVPSSVPNVPPSPVPSVKPSPTCVHPPGQKCRHSPSPAISVSVSVSASLGLP